MLRDPSSGATHLVASEALAVIDGASTMSHGASVREIAHSLTAEAAEDAALLDGLQRIIDGLVQSGLLHRVDDEADAGREVRR